MSGFDMIAVKYYNFAMVKERMKNHGKDYRRRNYI